MIKKILFVLLSLFITFILGVIFLLLGMNIGGNYFTNFELFGMRGYEATGNLGFIIGIILGIGISIFAFFKILKQKEKE